jgi:hypothetical protein
VIWEADTGSILYTPSQQAAYKERNKREREQAEQEEQMRLWRKAGGGFYFVATDGATDGRYEVAQATMARLVYLATYLGYDGRLYTTERTPMVRKDLQAVLGLSRAQTYRFWGEVSSLYVFEDEDGLRMGNQWFCRGKLSPGGRYQQFYRRAVRQLYHATPVSRHGRLGCVFQILPLLNIEYNIVCHNPMETCLDKVKPLTLDEFCVAVGSDPAHRSRIYSEYKTIKFSVGGDEERFCSFITDGGDLDTAQVVVNPHVLYHGRHPQQVEMIGKFCESLD